MVPGEEAQVKKSSHRALKICSGVTFLLLLIFIAVMVTLTFTLFKPKQPIILPQPANITHLSYEVWPNPSLNATVFLVVTIKNRNYGSFKYENTTANIQFHGEVVAQAAIIGDTMPSHGEKNVSTFVDIDGTKVLANPNFLPDYESGIMNFTSLTSMHGLVSVFKLLKFHATVHNLCNITVYVNTRTVGSICTAKLKL